MIGPLLIYSIMLIPTELGDALCYPVCLPTCNEPISTSCATPQPLHFVKAYGVDALFKFVPPSSPPFSLLGVNVLVTIINRWWKWGVHVSMLSHFLYLIGDMGVLAFPEVFAGAQLTSLPPWILELF